MAKETKRGRPRVAGVEDRGGLERYFGEQVRQLREAHGWKQSTLIRALSERGLKLYPAAVTRIERATRPVTLNEADTISRALGVDLGQLIGTTAGTTDGELGLAESMYQRAVVVSIECYGRYEAAQAAKATADRELERAVEALLELRQLRDERRAKVDELRAARGLAALPVVRDDVDVIADRVEEEAAAGRRKRGNR